MINNIVNPLYHSRAFSSRFTPAPPFNAAKKHAMSNGCDLTILNGPGFGDVLCFSRLVEDYARKLGRPLKLLTAPLDLHYGGVDEEMAYPIWEQNPFVGEIVNADEIDPQIMEDVICEKDNLFQYRHVIYNIGHHFGVSPHLMRPTIYLSKAEMLQAINLLRELPRPLICMHPFGVSSSPEGSLWHTKRWLDLIDRLHKKFGIFYLGRRDYKFKDLPIPHFDTTIREAFALIWAADIFIGFDSGFAHAATALEKKSFVLWDAAHKSPIEEEKETGFALATMSRWAYPQNENILLLGEKKDEVVTLIEKKIHQKFDLFY